MVWMFPNMRFNFSQPITSNLRDLGYIAFPVPTFVGEQTYTSRCAPGTDIADITVTATAYSFDSQKEADQIALNNAMLKAIAKRSLVPCP